MLGTTNSSSAQDAFLIRQRLTAVSAPAVGAIQTSTGRAHLLGRFRRSNSSILLQIQRQGQSVLTFSEANHSSSRGPAQSLRFAAPLSRQIRFLTGFDLSGDGFDDVAVIDNANGRLRWIVVENPLLPSRKVSRPFMLGGLDDRAEWFYDKDNSLHFAALAHSPNSSSI